MKDIFAITCLAGLLLCSCEEKKQEQVVEQPVSEQPQPVAPQPIHKSDSVRVDGHLYSYDVLMEVCDSLPAITDEDGSVYKDNTVKMVLIRDGQTYLNKTFDKSIFREQMKNDFYDKSILDGVRYVSTESGKGITFDFFVSYPDSEISISFAVTITDNGAYSIVRNKEDMGGLE